MGGGSDGEAGREAESGAGHEGETGEPGSPGSADGAPGPGQVGVPAVSGFERGTDGPKVVLAGLDGSESSWRATAYAGGLARRQHALLVVVYVEPVSGAGAGSAFGVPAPDPGPETARQLAAEITEATRRVRGIYDLRWEFHTYRGDPFGGLARAADELKADAVVVGASEQAGHRFVGSVAVRLVKAGRWPVTVVP
jgi:nucleotide-binding universal stress UspA family protein